MINMTDLLDAIEKANEKRAVKSLKKYHPSELASYKTAAGKSLLVFALSKFKANSGFIIELNKKLKAVITPQSNTTEKLTPTGPIGNTEQKFKSEAEESYHFVTSAAAFAAKQAGRDKAALSECSCDDMPRKLGLQDSPRDAMDELAIKWLTQTFPLSNPKNKRLTLLFWGEGKFLYLNNFVYRMNKLGYEILAVAQDPGYINCFVPDHVKEIRGTKIDPSYKHAFQESMHVMRSCCEKFQADNGFQMIVNPEQALEFAPGSPAEHGNHPFHAIFGVDLNQNLINAVPKIEVARQYTVRQRDALIFMSQVLNPETPVRPVSPNRQVQLFVTRADNPDYDKPLETIHISIPTGQAPKRIQNLNASTSDKTATDPKSKSETDQTNLGQGSAELLPMYSSKKQAVSPSVQVTPSPSAVISGSPAVDHPNANPKRPA